jgi:uncharacterized membrane protein (Fun14 family)
MSTIKIYGMMLVIALGVVIGTALGWAKKALCELKNWKH